MRSPFLLLVVCAAALAVVTITTSATSPKTELPTVLTNEEYMQFFSQDFVQAKDADTAAAGAHPRFAQAEAEAEVSVTGGACGNVGGTTKGSAPSSQGVVSIVSANGCYFLDSTQGCLAIQSITTDFPDTVGSPSFTFKGGLISGCGSYSVATHGCNPACGSATTIKGVKGTDATFNTNIVPGVYAFRDVLAQKYTNFNLNYNNLHRKTSCKANSVKPLVHGGTYFPELSAAIKRATSMIAICGWKLNLNLRLLRDDKAGVVTLKDHLIEALARSPTLRIRAILNPGSGKLGDSATGQAALNLEPIYASEAKTILEALDPHGRVQVFLMPAATGMSHHGKYWSFDYGTEAFVGGIDLASEPARYDTAQHRPTDVNDAALMADRADVMGNVLNQVKGVTNNRENVFNQGGAGAKNWHDVHVHITDPDLATQYWRVFMLRYLHFEKKGDIYAHPFPSSNPETVGLLRTYLTAPAILQSETAAAYPAGSDNWCQMVCSMDSHNGLPDGTDNADHSIGDAWVDAITNAKHYIHIEQQYFISRGGGLSSGFEPLYGVRHTEDIQNPVVIALIDRVALAIRRNAKAAGSDPLQVSVVLPFEADSNAHANMRRTIRYFSIAVRNLLGGAFTEDFNIADIGKYINFYAVRSFYKQTRNGQFFLQTAGVYVHAKMILVDDQMVVVGSANINDRSMLGSRDHEMGVYASNKRFALDLRNALFTEHLGVTVTDKDNANDLQRRLATQAATSLKCYQTAFPTPLPREQVATSMFKTIAGAVATDLKNDLSSIQTGIVAKAKAAFSAPAPPAAKAAVPAAKAVAPKAAAKPPAHRFLASAKTKLSKLVQFMQKIQTEAVQELDEADQAVAAAEATNEFVELKDDVLVEDAGMERTQFEETAWSPAIEAACSATTLNAKIIAYPFDLYFNTYTYNTSPFIADGLTNWGAFVEYDDQE